MTPAPIALDQDTLDKARVMNRLMAQSPMDRRVWVGQHPGEWKAHLDAWERVHRYAMERTDV